MNNEKIINELEVILKKYNFDDSLKNDIQEWINILGNDNADENDKYFANVQSNFLIKYLKNNKEITKIEVYDKYRTIIKNLEKIAAKKALDESILQDIDSWINTLQNENADENEKYFAEILGDYLIDYLKKNPDTISTKRGRK